jgi:hypothetical protein
MKTGAELISEERNRQIGKEGWSAEHDDMHCEGELALAAACYACVSTDVSALQWPAIWPWEWEWWKPSSDSIRNLVKAGALIAAEIDRLNRAKSKNGKGKSE